jgi:glyoxylase I family protein
MGGPPDVASVGAPDRRGMTSTPSGADPALSRISHVALTVTDLDVSGKWYERLLGTPPVLDEEAGGFWHQVYPLADGMLLGLHAHPGRPIADRFDPRRSGLDHVAFACADRAELDKWQARLDELGIAHGGIVDASYGSGLAFTDPDGTALEFFAPPGR